MARRLNSVKTYAQPDERELRKLREMAPTPRTRLRIRLIYFLWRFRLFEDRIDVPRSCCYCGRKAHLQTLAVSPITLRRSYYDLCRRQECSQLLRAWEGEADARRRRAQYDWERENPTVAPVALIAEIPPQYPSISRATLRAFLDSGYDVATLAKSTNWSVPALNGSIRRLGFADRVFAEIRSGQAVLRRVPGVA